MINRFLPPALPLYNQLYEIVKEKDYFALTTNIDHQFQKAGFQKERIFAIQGDYGNIQCEKGCHPKIYDAENLFHQMDQARRACLVPSHMVPKCPVYGGGNITMHFRCYQYFVEDENWHEAAGCYQDFLKRIKKKKGVLLELRLNMNEAFVPESLVSRAIGIGGNMAKVISDLSNGTSC